MTRKSKGQIAYEALRKAFKTTVEGAWEMVSPAAKKAWQAVARAVLKSAKPNKPKTHHGK